jgi:hypothetical protein
MLSPGLKILGDPLYVMTSVLLEIFMELAKSVALNKDELTVIGPTIERDPIRPEPKLNVNVSPGRI